jgi:L-aspartate oxidase
MREQGSYDFIVIGAGVAGLRAAIELGQHGSVLCLAKREVAESNTRYAQGGIAAALSDEDEISLHLQDTLSAGAGLCDVDAATVLVEEAPERIEELIQWGTEFDRKGTKLVFGREGAHSRNRILHAHGDSTGHEIGRALYHRAAAIKNIHFREWGFTTDLIVDNGEVTGVRLLCEDGSTGEIHAAATLLASGGMGHVYSNTTNPSVATGDGVAMAHRAGAELNDMEFIQFHPTALFLKNTPRFLLSEALRGEGAKLRNAELVRFMPKYHTLAELAPRDVVARAIMHEMEVSRAKEPVVYLDLTELDSEKVRAHFPLIYKTCREYNIDITEEMVPIRPAAHYSMGGVCTDLDGRTTLPRLYAAGEVASTGVHGANRLASNSLLEGLVYGFRAAESMATEYPASLPKTRHAAAKAPERPALVEDPALEALIAEAQQTMWNYAGIVRDAKGLRKGIDALMELQTRLPEPATRRQWEARNIVENGLLISRSAMARLESRGAHYRTDRPSTDDVNFLKHSVIVGDKLHFE